MEPAADQDYRTPDDRVRLLVGDCGERLAGFADSSVDVVVTSPPYNIGIGYNSYADNRDSDQYLTWLAGIFTELSRVLTDNGALFLNVGATNANPWLAYDVARQATGPFVLQNHIVWVKSVAVGDTTYGHFKPINSQRFLNNTFEDIFHFTATGNVAVDRRAVGVPFMDKSNIARFGHTHDRRCKGNVWHIPYKTVRTRADRSNHPATFPVALPEHCLKLHGVGPDTVVLDPFAGTGSTLLAARNLGAKAIGIELDADYASSAWERITGG